MSISCDDCENRGKVNGLSEETYCSSCVYQETWKVDWYKAKEGLTKESILPEAESLKTTQIEPTTESEGFFSYFGRKM